MTTARRRRRSPLARRTDRELLTTRFCDLGLEIDGWLGDAIADVQEDLARTGLRLRPHVWLSEEWFSPDGVPGVAVPFYLADPRLVRLERKQMLEVEGGTREECVRILRHEFGHAIQHAYRLQRSSRWREVFGSPAKKYPDFYRPNPASRRFVQHLRLYYAQSHPTEDFAETFAVWMQGPGVWRPRYEGWPALAKLEYVSELVKELRGVVPPVRTKRVVEPLRENRRTLGQHYVEKRKQYTVHYPAEYDRDLKRIFSSSRKDKDAELASTLLRRNRPAIRRMIARWTGEYQFTLDQVLNDVIGRCRELKLRAVGNEEDLRIDFALFLTVQTMQVLYARRSSIAL